jgi:hypothetical protein
VNQKMEFFRHPQFFLSMAARATRSHASRVQTQDSINRLHSPAKASKSKREVVSIGDRVILNGTLAGVMRFYGPVSSFQSLPLVSVGGFGSWGLGVRGRAEWCWWEEVWVGVVVGKEGYVRRTQPPKTGFPTASHRVPDCGCACTVTILFAPSCWGSHLMVHL